MKKIIFVFGFMLCVAFGASAKNNLIVETNKQELKQVTTVEYLYDDMSSRFECYVQITTSDGQEFWGAGDTCQEAFDQALDHLIEWIIYG